MRFGSSAASNALRGRNYVSLTAADAGSERSGDAMRCGSVRVSMTTESEE